MQRYNATAEMYDERYREEQTRKYRCILQQVKVAGETVLDFGCGSGLFFSHVAGDAELVVGIDVSHGLLLKAHRQAKNWMNVSVVQADADHLPFRDHCFGVGFAFTVLQNLPKPQTALSELKRVTHGYVGVTGLKKAFQLDAFMDVLEASGLKVASFVDDETINCYVAMLVPLSI